MFAKGPANMTAITAMNGSTRYQPGLSRGLEMARDTSRRSRNSRGGRWAYWSHRPDFSADSLKEGIDGYISVLAPPGRVVERDDAHVLLGRDGVRRIFGRELGGRFGVRWGHAQAREKAQLRVHRLGYR